MYRIAPTKFVYESDSEDDLSYDDDAYIFEKNNYVKNNNAKKNFQDNYTVEDRMIHELNNNKANVKSEEKKSFGKDINVLENSLNIGVGQQGHGKTFRISAEIIKISKASKESHMLIYFNKKGESNDATFESVKNLITIPIVYVAYDKAEEYTRKILAYKSLYQQYKSSKIKLQEKHIAEMNEMLKIKDFRKPYLHTLMCFEDFANNPLLKRSDGYFNQLFATLRHEHCTVFLSVQFWKSIPTEIKSNATTIFIFGGYSKQQLRYIISQIALPFSFEEIFDEYIQMKNKQCMAVNTELNTIKIL